MQYTPVASSSQVFLAVLFAIETGIQNRSTGYFGFKLSVVLAHFPDFRMQPKATATIGGRRGSGVAGINVLEKELDTAGKQEVNFPMITIGLAWAKWEARSRSMQPGLGIQAY
ncbi:MAG TPA: hypothetical protein VEQ38_01205 [Verrucomicrobiae bacterium]|nr:hypothetical protein [Verrucomicrobiae bacterium]